MRATVSGWGGVEPWLSGARGPFARVFQSLLDARFTRGTIYSCERGSLTFGAWGDTAGAQFRGDSHPRLALAAGEPRPLKARVTLQHAWTLLPNASSATSLNS